MLNTNYNTKPTLWNEQSNKQKQQEDIYVVVQFITQNMSFFYAPFYNKTKRLFTRWANANAKELAEVSDGLINNLPSEQAIELFSDALFSLKEDDDATSLIRILNKNKKLMVFFKECAEFPYPIIGKWDRYHKYDPAVDEWDRYYSVYK